MTVNVVDAGCGIGKTTSIINMINEDKSDNKYLYITPFLTEVTRIIKECPSHKFKEPQEENGENKMNDIKKLLSKGENVVSTHALFKKLDEELLDIIQINDYILIMDEVANVVDTLNISKDDLNTITTEYTTINENGLVEWTAESYEGKFEEYKKMIQLNSVVAYTGAANRILALIWLFPIKVFQSFKRIYLLTYMFDGQIQKYYYDLHNVKYKYLYVKDFHLTSEKQNYNMASMKSKIKICEVNNLNKIGNDKYALSRGWFERNNNNIVMKKLKSNTYSFFRNNAKSKVKDNLWTTFKMSKDYLKGKGYSGGFMPINIRATNELKHKYAVAYLANRYLNPVIKNFFVSNNIEVDEDAFALSELIQFIFRTRIRDNEEIFVYVPSKRMRLLLKKWLKEKDQ